MKNLEIWKCISTLKDYIVKLYRMMENRVRVKGEWNDSKLVFNCFERCNRSSYVVFNHRHNLFHWWRGFVYSNSLWFIIFLFFNFFDMYSNLSFFCKTFISEESTPFTSYLCCYNYSLFFPYALVGLTSQSLRWNGTQILVLLTMKNLYLE